MGWRERIEAGSENPEALLRLRAGLRDESRKIYEDCGLSWTKAAMTGPPLEPLAC